MGRIEEIKQRLAHNEGQFHKDKIALDDDVQFLLSLIQIAEEALNGMLSIFRDHDGWASIELDGLTYALSDEDYEKFVKAKDALEQIQK